MTVAISNVQNPSTVAQTNSTATQQVKDKTQLNKDDFMKLLIAQLKNQDPNAPVDAKEFVTQLSQLTSVEQLTNMSTQLKGLQMATTSLVNNQAAGFVGKMVEANGEKLYLGDLGGASSAINLTKGAEEVTVTVRDATGQAQRTLKLSGVKAGLTPITWDGNNDKGERMAAGSYTMSVEAKDTDGNAVVSSAQIMGIVSSVSYEHGFPELVVGDARVALANVTSIKQ
jgi:flagellar basal-body rod modification protein FlgD